MSFAIGAERPGDGDEVYFHTNDATSVFIFLLGRLTRGRREMCKKKHQNKTISIFVLAFGILVYVFFFENINLTRI